MVRLSVVMCVLVACLIGTNRAIDESIKCRKPVDVARIIAVQIGQIDGTLAASKPHTPWFCGADYVALPWDSVFTRGYEYILIRDFDFTYRPWLVREVREQRKYSIIKHSRKYVLLKEASHEQHRQGR